MTHYRKLLQALLIVTGVSVAVPARSQDRVLVEIERLRPNEIAAAGFELASKQEVSVLAVGIRHRSKRTDVRMSSAWILDADTRDVVWEMRDADSESVSDHLREYTSDLRLPAGRYEVYYASFPWSRGYGRDNLFGRALDDIIGRDFDYRDYRRAAKKFRVVVRGDGRALDEAQLIEYHRELQKNAIVSLTGLGKNRFEKLALTLDRRIDLELYAVGEMNKEGSYDYSWIIDTATRETVWRFDYGNSDAAGGASKNRMRKETISLPAGSYAIFCATDDSHDFEEWNSAPPLDPFFWGLTVRAADPGMAEYARTSDYKEVEDKNVLLQLTELRDEEFRSEGFTLKKPMELRVYAIGEGVSGDMADYSWIVDADTRETVWAFTYRRSDHAGGASKNRMVNEVIKLDKGDYLAYSITDGSHSYRDWNASQPHDPAHWGLTIFFAGGNKSDFTSYEEQEDKSVIAQIVRIGNNEYEHKSFKLARRSTVRIYAIGEGNRGRMYDYAWIESARTGRVIWEMTYRMTDHAGGARKNRIYNDTVTLDAGEYKLFYESDGSHSFNRWNAKPPADPWNWGVTVKMAKGE
ncbi:MAG: hypothetical protein ACE5EO_07420 [Candidatus Krumholzibacteriia bacterium]